MNLKSNIIVDLIRSRNQKMTLDQFFHILKKEKEAVEFICTNMSYTFKSILQPYFPHSTLLIDHFHVIKYINDQLNNIPTKNIRKQFNDKASLKYDNLKSKIKRG